MEKDVLIGIVSNLNTHNLLTFKGDFDEYLENVLMEFHTNIDHNFYKDKNEYLQPRDEILSCKYVSANFYVLFLLNDHLNDTKDILSVQQTKLLNKVFTNTIAVGILCNLQPNLPYYCNLPVDKNKTVLNSYNCLVQTVVALCDCLKCFHLRSFVNQNLHCLLVALYQVVYCPLKKPSNEPDSTGFVMTNEMYNKLSSERDFLQKYLDEIGQKTLKPLYVSETMLLLTKSNKLPLWFKKAVTAKLNFIITSENGLQLIISTMLDGTDDSTTNWNALSVISKLVLACSKVENYHDNICKQVLDLLKLKSVIYDRVFVSCAKILYTDGKNSTLIDHLFKSFSNAITVGDKPQENTIQNNVKLIHMCFVDNPPLPINLLVKMIPILFKMYIATINIFKTLNQDLKELILLYLENSSVEENYANFDTLIFGLNANCRNDIYFDVTSESISLKFTSHTVLYPVEEAGSVLYELLQAKSKLLIILFKYFLKCLIDTEKYFKLNTNSDLLYSEDSAIVNEAFKRKLMVYKLLSELAESKHIQKYLNENPDDLLKYMKNLLVLNIKNKSHRLSNEECDSFQSLFTVVMILQAFITNSDKPKQFKILYEPLSVIYNESENVELKKLTQEILKHIEGDKTTESSSCMNSEFGKAIEDICDPLLPVRGHGLMKLAKLVENKDKETIEKKQYVLNIFQQNLKNEDSFIYLSAINGLAALANVFPEVVITVLTEEFSDFTRENDGHEVRMKLGEVLVKITKSLGETAPKYKMLLLNTFLVGTKDDDHLIRASSLSNLGEVCRVLGYKLGTIISEILVCVNCIITTDKAVEARRAAVTVIRQLFVGLESEMITFLKDEILTIYRSLKQIYNNDLDDVMRLQAQLALEELNENVKKVLFPISALENKILMLS